MRWDGSISSASHGVGSSERGESGRAATVPATALGKTCWVASTRAPAAGAIAVVGVAFEWAESTAPAARITWPPNGSSSDDSSARRGVGRPKRATPMKPPVGAWPLRIRRSMRRSRTACSASRASERASPRGSCAKRNRRALLLIFEPSSRTHTHHSNAPRAAHRLVPRSLPSLLPPQPRQATHYDPRSI